MLNMQDFHDAKLIHLLFDWKSKILECLLEPVSPDEKKLKLIFDGVSNIVIPAKDTWGNSEYINKFSERKLAEASLFSIEMQSGDTLEILAMSFQFFTYNFESQG